LYGFLGPDVADEVIVAVVQPSPWPWLEIHCHGGMQISQWLIELFRERGCIASEWQDFYRETGPTWQAAALEQLARASTTRTAAILLDQYEGALGLSLRRLRSEIQDSNFSAAREHIQDLLRFANLGLHLVKPWKIVVAGPPNAGKSSLVNALTGFQRSIVTPIPGTTRDAVSTFLAIEGWPMELIDTAGIRAEAMGLEAQGVALSYQQIATADLCLWLWDVSVAPVWPDDQTVNAAKRIVIVPNKVDRIAAGSFSYQSAEFHPKTEKIPPISALTGQGLPALCSIIGRILVPEMSPPGTAIPLDQPFLACLEQIDAVLANGNTGAALELLNPWL